MALYIPGYGLMSREEIDIDRICKKHDPNLVFRRNPQTGHMTIFQRLMRDNVYVRHQSDNLVDGDLFPVRAYPDRMPSPDEVEKWLYEHDAYRWVAAEEALELCRPADVAALLRAALEADAYELDPGRAT